MRKARVGVIGNRNDQFFDYGLHNRKKRKIEGGHGSIDLRHTGVFKSGIDCFHLAAGVDHEGANASNIQGEGGGAR